MIFVHNALVGINLRDQIRLIVSGKVTTGFSIASKLALGADICNSARGMMFALGCIQALRCNSNTCPAGVATQDLELVGGLNVPDKAQRVANFHRGTVHSFLEVLAAAGLALPSDLRPWHIHRRITSSEVKNYSEIYKYIETGSLLKPEPPAPYARPWICADSTSFTG